MGKDGRIAVRLDAPTKEALEEAAAEDRRSVSSMVEKIVVEWLRKRPGPPSPHIWPKE